MGLPLLTCLLCLPLIAGGLLLALRNLLPATLSRFMAVFFSAASTALSLWLISHYQQDAAVFQWAESHHWIPVLGAQYSLAVDGIALSLIVLTNVMTFFVLFMADPKMDSFAEYQAGFLLMQGLICGALAATDALLFYVFWEAMLVPIFLLIGIYGGTNRIYATVKFFLYTFLGSVFLLLALLYLHHQAALQGVPIEQSFAINSFQSLAISESAQHWLFWAFLLAFAVKIPMFPLHTWLPDAHVEAPTGGSVILAAILLKMGAYGFLRFILPITPLASLHWSTFLIVLSLIGIVYIGFVALVQNDLKKLIAYSSIAHMGFVTLGLVFALKFAAIQDHDSALMAIQGAFVQMISHGLISGALFFCIGILYERLHSRLIKDYGGVANVMPAFAALFLFFAMSNAGLPGTSGFVGEFLVILSAFKMSLLSAILAALTLILGASYSLWMTKRVLFGPTNPVTVMGLKDIGCKEQSVLMILAALVLCLGLWPEPLLKLNEASLSEILIRAMAARSH